MNCIALPLSLSLFLQSRLVLGHLLSFRVGVVVSWGVITRATGNQPNRERLLMSRSLPIDVAAARRHPRRSSPAADCRASLPNAAAKQEVSCLSRRRRLTLLHSTMEVTAGLLEVRINVEIHHRNTEVRRIIKVKIRCWYTKSTPKPECSKWILP